MGSRACAAKRFSRFRFQNVSFSEVNEFFFGYFRTFLTQRNILGDWAESEEILSNLGKFQDACILYCVVCIRIFLTIFGNFTLLNLR